MLVFSIILVVVLHFFIGMFSFSYWHKKSIGKKNKNYVLLFLVGFGGVFTLLACWFAYMEEENPILFKKDNN